MAGVEAQYVYEVYHFVGNHGSMGYYTESVKFHDSGIISFKDRTSGRNVWLSAPFSIVEHVVNK